MKSVQQRQEERRQEKLDEVRRQVESGSLTIRKMTPEERKAYPRVDNGSETPAESAPRRRPRRARG
jgi:hypothetical protein